MRWFNAHCAGPCIAQRKEQFSSRKSSSQTPHSRMFSAPFAPTNVSFPHFENDSWELFLVRSRERESERERAESFERFSRMLCRCCCRCRFPSSLRALFMLLCGEMRASCITTTYERARFEVCYGEKTIYTRKEFHFSFAAVQRKFGAVGAKKHYREKTFERAKIFLFLIFILFWVFLSWVSIVWRLLRSLSFPLVFGFFSPPSLIYRFCVALYVETFFSLLAPFIIARSLSLLLLSSRSGSRRGTVSALIISGEIRQPSAEPTSESDLWSV
jgi:hypothetical protein